MVELPPGTQFGPYRILRTLGVGGMGAVYAAQGPGGAEVALKVLAPGGSAEDAARFQREAEAHARVDAHPSVARIHSAGQLGDRSYLVMDLLSKGDLKDRLRAGPLPPEEVRQLGITLAAGLAHVHAQGVLHRDVKPANVLFDDAGRPRLTDFGITRPIEASSLTQSGAILGTPGYMAPEQAGIGKAGVGSDVFGLGATLYAALTGQAPFVASTTLETLTKLMVEDPPPLPPSVPEDLRLAIGRALEKEPADRFLDAASFGEALRGGARAPRGGRGGLLWVGLALAACGLGLGAWSLGSSPEPRREPNPELSPGPGLTPPRSPSSPPSPESSPSPNPGATREFAWRIRKPVILTPGAGAAASQKATLVAVTWLTDDQFLSVANNGVVRLWKPNSEGAPIATRVEYDAPITMAGAYPHVFGGGPHFGASFGSPVQTLEIVEGQLRGALTPLEDDLRLMTMTHVRGDRYLFFGRERLVLWRLGAKSSEWSFPLEIPPKAPDSSPHGAIVLGEAEGQLDVLLSWSPNKDAGKATEKPQLERFTVGPNTPPTRAWIRPAKGRFRAFVRQGAGVLCGDDVGGIWEGTTLREEFQQSRLKRPEGGFVLGVHEGTIRGLAPGPNETLVSLGSRVPDLKIWSTAGQLLRTHAFQGDLSRGVFLVISEDRRFALVQGPTKVALVPLEEPQLQPGD